ncbi:MAG TPA: maltose alpha-D-glucosyltransferase [Candidatus Sulfotelmatobacter sp.]|nr:maltose alpha-D-glucosyltransferase [Candidatus Sulfotelmatobacter sp.]
MVTKIFTPLERDPLWYKAGVIYEVHVRAFFDSNADGTGDFRGLTQKLDYLRDLGVTAIWLLPFYPSPLKDDGYDIADYMTVHPMYGTLADFKVFLREAHRRGLRVITELVLNHTSDKHPWFQRSRRAKPGSHWRDYYVWSDSPEKYAGTRIIFKDTELSNWTWDGVANAYYWHRFYSHQPDLNFDNPVVHREMFKVLDFWFGMGVDGVRLDAVPYLYEREGTGCENLPETHEFLKILRKHVDEKYGDRMLLAEANQWPDDAVAYFGGGKGDECHMAFHFPLMPRLFMALRMEDRIPIVDILQQTPPIPETAQWALFLRNHDELTLEMVTDEERDYMYRMYAHIYQARLNLGIRRRLAPLLGNDRRRIELLNALLFSLPGTPVIYYGDEIGIGENIYLGDRNGVRTPMQWSADKNAGFSRANPQSLYLPINLDPENHYEAVNVDVQQRNPHSLLWWMRRLITLRKRWRAFGLGTMEFLQPENRKIFACIRRYQDETILVVANLSRFVQPVELDLKAFQKRVPVELFGLTEFPVITEKPYFLTLGPHAFYWFSLEARTAAQVQAVGAPVGPGARQLFNVNTDWAEIFNDYHQVQFERALQSWLVSRRWFSGKARTVKGVHVRELIPVPLSNCAMAYFAFLQVEYTQNEPDIYVLPLACAFGAQMDAVCRDWAPLAIARVSIKTPQAEGVLYDAISNKEFCRILLDAIASRRSLPGSHGNLTSMHTSHLRQLRMAGSLNLEPSVGKAEQSNSSVLFGDKLILKLFRRLDQGENPEFQISRLLTARRFPYSPPLAGAMEYHGEREEPMTVAVLDAFLPKCKDAWEFTLDTLGRFYERVESLPPEHGLADAPVIPLDKLAAVGPSPDEVAMVGAYIENARMLGQRTAAMHLALAAETTDKRFTLEPFTPHFQRGLFQSFRNLTRQNFQLLARKLNTLAPDVQALADKVIALEPDILKRLSAIYSRRIDAWRMRQHGDYHLGQVLYDGKDFWIIDFEGEPSLSISERCLKRPPMSDVASMIRSFHYAAQAGLLKEVESGGAPGQTDALTRWGQFWARHVSAIFYRAYLDATKGAAFLPRKEEDLHLLTNIFLLRKAIYELGYELNSRPDWVKIPLKGIIDLMRG